MIGRFLIFPCILFFLMMMLQVFPSRLFAKESIAVVDINEIFQTSLVTVNLNDQLQAKQSELKKQFESKEKELREEQKMIESQKGIITDVSLEEKMRLFNQNVADTQANAKSQKSVVEKEYFAALETINNKLKDIIAKHSINDGIDMVLHKSQVIYKSDAYPDITTVVISKLNKDLPYIKMIDSDDSLKLKSDKKPDATKKIS